MKTFKKNQVISREGSKQETLMILLKGSVAIYKGDIKIAEFSETGTILGELGLILEKERTATIVALADTEVVDLDLDLDTLIIKYPGITRTILKSLAQRLVAMTDNYWELSSKTRIDDLSELENDYPGFKSRAE